MGNQSFGIDENQDVDHDVVWHGIYDDEDEFRHRETVTQWWVTYEFYSKQENKSGYGEE